MPLMAVGTRESNSTYFEPGMPAPEKEAALPPAHEAFPLKPQVQPPPHLAVL
jgi:hypothetical protein